MKNTSPSLMGYGRGPLGWWRERRAIRRMALAEYGMECPWWWSNRRVRAAVRGMTTHRFWTGGPARWNDEASDKWARRSS